MLRHETVPRSKIRVDRDLEPDDLEWINKGPDFYPSPMPPILVDDQYRLLDGLRRLQAFGPKDRVPVIVSDTLPETLTVMAEVPEGRPTTPLRAWKLFLALTDQAKGYWSLTRGQKGKPNRAFGGGRDSDRTKQVMMAKALKVTAHWMQGVQYVFGRADGVFQCPEELVPLAQELAKRLTEGYNVHTAQGEFRKALRGQQKRILSEREQRATLRSITSSLAAINHALDDMGPLHPRIKASDAAEWLPAFIKARRLTRTMAAILKERANQ